MLAPDQGEGRNECPATDAVNGLSFTDRLVVVGARGRQRTFSATARPLQNNEGSLRGSVIAFTEVTVLVKAQTAKDKFVATVSHELRTPLTSILGYLEILEEQPNRRYVGIIERNAKRLLALVNNLLLVAARDLELRRQPTNVSDLIQQSIQAAKPGAAVKSITIATVVPANVAANVDRGQFAKVIDQLLSNAIKFSPEGSQITLKMREDEDELEVSISDQGMGMTGEEQEQAFTKFFRADRAMETAIPGAGLGLPLSKAVIEAHGGIIGLRSTPGSGTTVTIVLPSHRQKAPVTTPEGG